MTKSQFDRAYAIAVDSNISLNDENIDHFFGYGLGDFMPISCSTRQLANVIRWQACRLNGSVDMEQVQEIRTIGRAKFLVVD